MASDPESEAQDTSRSMWSDRLRQLTASYPVRPRLQEPTRRITYVVQIARGLMRHGLAVAVRQQRRVMNGSWGGPTPFSIRHESFDVLTDPADRAIHALLLGASHQFEPERYSRSEHVLGTHELRLALLPLLCGTGRCYMEHKGGTISQTGLAWDESGPWELRLAVESAGNPDYWQLRGLLRRDDEQMDLSTPLLIVEGGLVFTYDRVAPLIDHDSFELVRMLRSERALFIPKAQEDDLIEKVQGLPHSVPVEWPEALRMEESLGQPSPHLKILPPSDRSGYRSSAADTRLRAMLSFDYGEKRIRVRRGQGRIVDTARRRLILRNWELEAAATELLTRSGFRDPPPHRLWDSDESHDFELAPRWLPRAVSALVQAGWRVEAEGKIYRRPGSMDLQVRSGIDWFELHGRADFEGLSAGLPALLAAIRKRENTVVLDDGTIGILPEEWLRRYGLVAAIGSEQGDAVRFERPHLWALDALLAERPEVTCDDLFRRARDELRTFSGIEPAEPPPGFRGVLRPYQRDGLGWFGFLRRFRFGGCLADDMGLGKTVQVLALLEARRMERAAARGSARLGPSLVVVPKSLVYNWKAEIARFSPQLRTLDHTGTTRVRAHNHFDDYDVVITTYGTLRRDAAWFKDVVFDYVILDEAQQIKNANSEAAKAARLLRAEHRLALSGTPIENHLGELWSLFEFLNPGMLGAASVFQRHTDELRPEDSEARAMLAKAVRPFLLRRTKQQVAKDLPERVEQTLYCDLDPRQRKLYDELRDHYRGTIFGKIEADGIARSKLHILEALLRLRQAALHPGLIQPNWAMQSSTKIDLLMEYLSEVCAEDHKALIFSQFTTMLAIVRFWLDRHRIRYEYLDGKTGDRAARIERFQTDPERKLFLISLKAGGLGLNLTAAEYVFLLDPWWNPAVEAQAIDRAHRIGQTRQVFAYRIIARDTVEERVLELQSRKKALADAVITADNSLIRHLTRDDLDMLLS